MAKINLLPWRDELRKKRKRDFFTAMGLSALLTLMVIGAVHGYIEGLKAYQTQRNTLLQNEIAMLEKKIVEIRTIEEKKSKLLAKIDLIHKLQASRPEIVHLFDEIPKATPDGVFLSKFSQVGSSLIFEGKSQSNARVSAFMRAIDVSPWLDAPRLDVIQVPKTENGEQLSDFVLHATLGGNKTKTEAGK
ncbi:Fimbrial assembly family protein [Crenothrix polyspora]|uniref:Fimbrial assembly family protein n=1 Tax=Crenothrix polyspora TaxID=360316 RepID=A0A1R4HCL8_9GAMM|nr:PilN domain-containing protein [Crenothrix polyspora]SJM93959.1 Fimbrial assembly family protein [Crenothrix polyspora]